MAEGGAARRDKDKRMAAFLKAHNIVRTSGICAACYRTIRVDSSQSTYKHICHGGR